MRAPTDRGRRSPAQGAGMLAVVAIALGWGGAAAAAAPEGMVVVAAGPAWLGDDRGEPDERPRRQEVVARFAISRTEVSNADYGRFLEAVAAAPEGDAAWAHPAQPAGKDHTPRYWKPYVPPLVRSGPVGKLLLARPDTFKQPEHPVVGVDFWDAWAYCRWLGARLPSEAEWEKAARGTDGRTWPWGSDWAFARANSGGYEQRGERDGAVYTAPVTAYPDGASPFGALNMAGNVWEWTATVHAGAGQPSRIIKGGAFNSYPSSLRPARRAAYEPAYRAFNLGLRCAVGGAHLAPGAAP